MRAMRARRLAVGVLLLAVAGCKRVDEDAARGLVRGYLDKLVQAYRASDAEIVDPLVTEPLGRRLTGLIGAKRDMGLVLDSHLLELAFEGIGVDGEAVVVETRERWEYRHRRIGSGEQVGEGSVDSYAVRYRLVREGGRLKVAEVGFREPPVVAGGGAPMKMDTRTAHGLPEGPPARDAADGRREESR